MAEQKEKATPFLVNDQQISAIKDSFAGNNELLMSIRALLMGFEIDEATKNIIKSTFTNETVREAFREKLYPKLSPTSLIGQGGDFWFGTDTEIIGRDPETIKQLMQSKKETLGYFDHAFRLLDDPFGKAISLEVECDFKKDPYQISFIARNRYLSALGTALAMIKAIAGEKKENLEQAKLRLFRDSSK